MDEQRVREIVREELAELLITERPVVNFKPSIDFINADAITDRFVRKFEDRLLNELQCSRIEGVYDIPGSPLSTP